MVENSISMMFFRIARSLSHDARITPSITNKNISKI